VNYLLDSHGWGLGEHNHWIKYTNWELDARIPLIIHAPHKPHTWGTRQSTALVEHVDLYPTISELAGIAVPVRKRHFLSHLYIDRLGTNIGKTQKKCRFPSG
jgi:arylsulfatase A-like enzyme